MKLSESKIVLGIIKYDQIILTIYSTFNVIIYFRLKRLILTI